MLMAIDSREPYEIYEEFKTLSETVDDLKVIRKKLDTGDYLTEHFIIERKTLDDLISSMFPKKDSEYERLDSQLDRLVQMKQPIKILLITGSNFEDAYSGINEHSFNGKLAKIPFKWEGVQVQIISESNDWIDYVYRLCRMANKYGAESQHQTCL